MGGQLILSTFLLYMHHFLYYIINTYIKHMAQQVKIPQGNSFVLELICMKQINDTGDKIAFDMAASENIAISFFDETHENNIELTDWSFAPGTNNVIRVNVDGTNLPVQSKLGLIISGIDPQGEKFKTKIRGRNFIYVVGSISDVSANDFITNPLTIQVTMNIMGDLKPVNFDDFVTVEVLEEKEAETLAAAKQYTDEAIAAITGPDLSNYATKEYADNAATGAVNSANTYTNSTALSLRSEYVAGINHEKDERVAAVSGAVDTAKQYTDAAIAAITGTGGVTQEYVDEAISGVNATIQQTNATIQQTNETIQDIDDRYLELSQYKDEPLTFYNPGSEAVTLYFGNLGVYPDSLDWNQTEGNITEFSMVVGETRYLKTADPEKTQREDFYLGVEIPAGETAIVRGIMGSSRGALSFASSGELEVAGNLCSLYNEDFLYNNYYANGFDNMFMHIDDPIYTGVEVLKVKDYSKVYLDYTNYSDEAWAYSYNILDKMFYNNEWIEKAPILVNYKIRNSHDPAIGGAFYGCRNLVEVTDYSLNTWHSWNFIFNFIDEGEPYEGYKCLTDGLTVNLPLGSAEEDKRYYQQLQSDRPDINMTINYITDYKAPYTSNGLIAKGLNSYISQVEGSLSDINGRAELALSRTNGFTNINETTWDNTDNRFNIADDEILDQYYNDTLNRYIFRLNEGYGLHLQEHDTQLQTTQDPQVFRNIINGINGAKLRFYISDPVFSLGNWPSQASNPDYTCYYKEGFNYLFDFKDADYIVRDYETTGNTEIFRFGWNEINYTQQDIEPQHFIRLNINDFEYVGEQWNERGIEYIDLYLGIQITITAEDGYISDTQKIRYWLYGETNTGENLYLSSNSNFIHTDIIDYVPGELKIDKQYTSIEGSLIIAPDFDVKQNIEDIWGIVDTLPSQEYVDEAVSGLATQTFVNEAVSGLATETYVDNAIAAITGPDLSQYATQTFVNEAVSGLATEAYVDAAVSGAGGVSQQYVDDAVSGCLVDAKSYTDNAISALDPVLPYEELPYEEQYLTVELTSGSFSYYFLTVSLSSADDIIQYSFDRQNWTTIPRGDNQNINRSSSYVNKMYFRGNKITSSNFNIKLYNHYTYNVYGNLASIVYGDDFKNKDIQVSGYNLLMKLFADSTALISAKHLYIPTMKSAYGAYMLFMNCTSLVEGPENLFIHNAGTYAYGDMFRGCTSLTTAPKIIGKEYISNQCYEIFNGCSSLTYVYTEFTGGISSSNTANWLNNVGANGKLFVSDDYTNSIPDGPNGLPQGWTLLHTSDYNPPHKYEVDEDIKPLLYNMEAVSADNEEITLTLNTNEYNKVYLVDYTASTPEYVTGDTTITLTGTADYNVSILKFKTDANFSSLTLDNQSSAALKWIGDDFTTLEPNKEYEIMFEYTNAFELIVSWAEVTTATVNP